MRINRALRNLEKLLSAHKSEFTVHSRAYSHDSRVRGDQVDLGRKIESDFAKIRDTYLTPRYPIVLAHGLLGFDELRPAGAFFPAVQYWRGIAEAFTENGIDVITASVPAAASIEERAKMLKDTIVNKARGKEVNIIAGLDARYMIKCTKQEDLKVLSLTTIATPHRGSSFADHCFSQIGVQNITKVYGALERLGFDTGAFKQLTTDYMKHDFNPRVPDVEDVSYFSYGAAFEPSPWSTFRQSHRIIQDIEGPNDGLVSVKSSKWGGQHSQSTGGYQGTLVGVSHLDLINWTNRLRWYFGALAGHERKFNAVAFYLHIADLLAKKGF